MVALAENRKSKFDFEILETFEAGIELFGFEVKAIQAHRMSMEGSYIFPKKGEVWLIGATIAPYQSNNTPKDYNLMRDRKLLLHKAEIGILIGAFSTKGLTILPIKVYNKGRKIKLELGIAKKRKTHDKRSHIKEREDKRKIERTLKEI